MPKISCCIPAYEMNGQGAELLERAIISIKLQTFTDYEIVVSDNSFDDSIKNLCENYPEIKYFRNPIRGMARNTNEAIKSSTGELIKVLYMDDYLNGKNALKEIIEAFRGNWLATACTHLQDGKLVNTHYPEYNHNIYKGINTIGSPSVITLRNMPDLPLFDENMTWLLDCDFYKRMYDKFGEPTFLYKPTVVMGLHKNQITNMLSEDIKRHELNYMIKKYE